jgi:tRNA(fMet)-specific endonuclease VapC
MYLLDTNTLIYFFKNMGNVAHRLLSESPKNVAIPAVVLFELEFGIAKSSAPQKRRKQLEGLLSTLTTLPFGVSEAHAAARIRAQLESKGSLIGPYDMLIAGTAVVNRATLVTHNTKEFGRIDHLQVEDWY